LIDRQLIDTLSKYEALSKRLILLKKTDEGYREQFSSFLGKAYGLGKVPQATLLKHFISAAPVDAQEEDQTTPTNPFKSLAN
jgi:hypothetical protein